VAEALAWLNGWIAVYLAWCARIVGSIPHAQVASARTLLLFGDAGALAWLLLRLRAPRLRRAGRLCGTGLALGLTWRLLG
jgi:hypothetical protein